VTYPIEQVWPIASFRILNVNLAISMLGILLKDYLL